MSVLVAKSFCSHLCPVGTLSEGLGRLGVRLLGRTWLLPRWLDVPLRALKYVLLAFFLWATWVALDLPGVRAFLDSPYNRVADTKMLLFFAHPSRLTVAVLGVLVVGSVLVRDLWCRYLCPYGALLGVLGRLAPLKVTRNADTCIDCRKCTKVCPARLPVHAMGRMASVECTSCQDCVAVCPIKECLAVRPTATGGHVAAAAGARSGVRGGDLPRRHDGVSGERSLARRRLRGRVRAPSAGDRLTRVHPRGRHGRRRGRAESRDTRAVPWREVARATRGPR